MHKLSFDVLAAASAEAGDGDTAREMLEVALSSTLDFKLDVVNCTRLAQAFRKADQPEYTPKILMLINKDDIPTDTQLYSVLLTSCADMASGTKLREVHSHLNGNSKDLLNNFVVSALIHSYAKCGCLQDSEKVFAGYLTRHSACKPPNDKDCAAAVDVWSAMIAAYGMHGRGKDALAVFNEMIKQGHKPDTIAFICVLSACSMQASLRML